LSSAKVCEVLAGWYVFSCPQERCKDRWDEEGKMRAYGRVRRGKVVATGMVLVFGLVCRWEGKTNL
jgi:hypothetical protein